MKILKQFIPFIALMLLFTSCFEDKVDIPDEVTGLAPVYYDGDWKVIETADARPIKNLFKIYYKDNILFVGESQRGIHIIDNSDPFNPTPIKFIQIIGNSDIAIKGNILYANNLSDLVALDIRNINDIKLLSREENVFPNAGSTLPDNYFGFFECPDPNMGAIVGWAETTLESPECWR